VREIVPGWSKGTKYSRHDAALYGCFAGFVLLALGFMLFLISRHDGQPYPTRDKMLPVHGVVYRVSEQRWQKSGNLNITVSVRTLSGGSWTGPLQTCGLRESELASRLGPRFETVRRLTGERVELLTYRGTIGEISVNGQMLLSYDDVRACYRSG
jgi:hypothetical protein